MLFKELSPSGIAIQLPKLVLGKRSSEYFDIIADFYEVALDPTVYLNSQVYLGSDNKLKLDLVPVTIDLFNDILFFTGKNPVNQAFDESIKTIDNPMQTIADAFLNQSPVWVGSVNELDFLTNLELNTPRNVFTVNDETPRLLSALLSGGRSQIRWGVGSLNEYSTAGFSLIYVGSVKNAPSVFAYPELAKTVAIVSLLQGNNKGMVMLCSDQDLS